MIETKFKQTEIGPIPEDWEVSSLSDVGEIKMCKRILKFQTSNKGDIPFYKIGTFGKVADAYISRELFEEYRQKYNYPKKGDILLSAAGTIGRTVVFDGKPSYFQDSNIVWINNDESLILNSLLYFIYDRVSWVTESGTIPRIYNGIVHSIKIAHPKSIVEQEKIAKALSDVDALISDLDGLIVKKRYIKQGAMQELLTGKTRLAGFNGIWHNKEIGEIVSIVKGQNLQSKDFILGSVPVVAGGKSYAGYHNVCNHDKTCVTISASGAYAGYVWLHEYPIFASDCSVIEGNDEVDIHFLYNLLKMNQEAIYQSQTGGAQPHIHPKDIAPIRILMPSLLEQKAIASILVDMDKEILALEAKKAKYESIKQGMMQELLTGKIRLV